MQTTHGTMHAGALLTAPGPSQDGVLSRMLMACACTRRRVPPNTPLRSPLAGGLGELALCAAFRKPHADTFTMCFPRPQAAETVVLVPSRWDDAGDGEHADARPTALTQPNVCPAPSRPCLPASRFYVSMSSALALNSIRVHV